MLGERGEDVQIAAATEGLVSRSGKDHDPYRSLLPDPSECIPELEGHPAVDRIPFIGTVEGNPAYRVVRAADLVSNCLVLLRSHERESSRVICAIGCL